MSSLRASRQSEAKHNITEGFLCSRWSERFVTEGISIPVRMGQHQGALFIGPCLAMSSGDS